MLFRSPTTVRKGPQEGCQQDVWEFRGSGLLPAQATRDSGQLSWVRLQGSGERSVFKDV